MNERTSQIIMAALLMGFLFTTGIVLGALVTAREMNAPPECPGGSDVARVHRDYTECKGEVEECTDALGQCASLIKRITESP